jgi:hypothetical protein
MPFNGIILGVEGTADDFRLPEFKFVGFLLPYYDEDCDSTYTNLHCRVLCIRIVSGFLPRWQD